MGTPEYVGAGMGDRPQILCVATQGAGSNDEKRIRELLNPLSPEVWPFDREAKFRSGLRLTQRLRADRPDLVVLEGTGLAVGMTLLAHRIFRGVRYVVSSGDAVTPFLT